MDQMFPAHTCALLLLLSPSVVSDSVWPHGQKPARLLCPGIFEGRILEWVAIPFFRGSSWLKVQNHVSCTTGRFYIAEFISVQFSHSVMSNSWRPHELQHARPPCPSPLPESTQIHVHWVSDAIHCLILCCLLLLPPSVFPSIRVFCKESALHIR